MNIYSHEEEEKKSKRGKMKDEDMRNRNGRGFKCAGRPEVWKVPILCVR
jgi:hypothetical protein